MSALLLILLAAPPPVKFDAQRTEHLDELARQLKRHTASLEVRLLRKKRQPLEERERTGFGVVISPHLVATNYFVVERAESIDVIGPKRRRIPGRVVLADIDRRVALIRTEMDLSRTGLEPAQFLEQSDRRRDMDIFALVSTLELSGVLHGELTDTGSSQELEGHPRISLVLASSMPVFDGNVRFVGYARAVSWDKDKQMLVPAEMITGARTATAAAALKAMEPQKDSRPWWAK